MNHSDRLYSILLSKRYEMRCLTNSAFLFSGPSGRRKARQKDFLLRKAKVRGSESRDLMRIGRSFGEKKQAFAPKEVSVSRKCLLLFEISPNVFPDYFRFVHLRVVTGKIPSTFEPPIGNNRSNPEKH